MRNYRAIILTVSLVFASASELWAFEEVINNLTSAETRKKVNTEYYDCVGKNIEGQIQITNFAYDPENVYRDQFGPFEAISRFKISGRDEIATLKMRTFHTYFKRKLSFFEGGFLAAAQGMWDYDENRIIYPLGGASLELNPYEHFAAGRVSDILRLEKNVRTGSAKGYIGHRDEDSNRRREYPDYNFRCKLIKKVKYK